MELSTYRREILERFLTEAEQKELDRKYEESKIVKIGRKKVRELKGK